MSDDGPPLSARRTELLELAYQYVLRHGLGDVSLRPLASAVGSSPRVLLYLFDSKDGLVRALLARARVDELALLDRIRSDHGRQSGLAATAELIWAWLAAPEHRSLLTLWAEGYTRSLIDVDGPWAGFASAGVGDWLDVLATVQLPAQRRSAAGLAQRTLALSVLRGALLDLLATGDTDRTTRGVKSYLQLIS
jgi:AcrR family transcriptional regulator